MLKKSLFFICVLLVFEAKSDCQGYFECFNSFFSNFFVDNSANVEYLNISSNNLPENFVEVKDVQVGDINKVLSELSSFIQQDITDKLKIESDAAFSNVNPDTKIYVKTFSYKKIGNLEQDSDNVLSKKYKEQVKIENRSQALPQTKTQVIKKSNRKHVSDNEIPTNYDMISYYDFDEDNSTDYPIIDYVDLYKDTTNEESLYEATESPVGKAEGQIQQTIDEYIVGLDNIIWDINNNNDSSQNSTDISDVYPWISAIFLKNDSKSNQFEYFCDGALLSQKLLITAARCVNLGNSPVDPDSLLVILGKRSLLSMGEKEKVIKVKEIITHENFTNENGKIEHDLALLMLEDVDFNDIIQSATIGNDTQDVEKLVTTAWDLQGDMVPVYLDDKENNVCNSRDAGKNMFCATYGQDVALCPSYGGIFAGKQEDIWYLYGIRSGDTADRGICFDKHVWFTDLRIYQDWIMEHFE